jgi:2-methylcitrate dehydratase PrpD
VTVFAIVADLMDRARIDEQILDVHHTTPGRIGALAGAGDLVLVDLKKLGDAVGLATATGARVIGFAPHVDDEILAQAERSGCEALPRSVFFRRLPNL